MNAAEWASRWSVAHPRPDGPWTVRCGQTWGVLDPETGRAERVDPSADRRLPGLASAVGTGVLRGYRVGRRAVVESAEGFTKLVRPGRMDGLVYRHELLARSGLSVRVPEVRRATSDGRVELTTMPGRSLHHMLRDEPGTPMEPVGELVAALHEVAVPSRLPARSVDDPARWLLTSRRSPTPHLPMLESIAGSLPVLEPKAEVLVHGDLHDKNVFVGYGDRHRGGGLIDLDGVAVGAAEDDLANLAVHLELRNLQARTGLTVGRRTDALYRGYRSVRPLDDERLAAIERHTWFRLAALYQYRRSGTHLVPRLLRLAVCSDTRQHDGDLGSAEFPGADLQ